MLISNNSDTFGNPHNIDTKVMTSVAMRTFFTLHSSRDASGLRIDT